MFNVPINTLFCLTTYLCYFKCSLFHSVRTKLNFKMPTLIIVGNITRHGYEIVKFSPYEIHIYKIASNLLVVIHFEKPISIWLSTEYNIWGERKRTEYHSNWDYIKENVYINKVWENNKGVTVPIICLSLTADAPGDSFRWLHFHKLSLYLSYILVSL